MFSEEKIFRNWPIRNNNCLWWPCLLTNRNEMSNLYRRPSVYVFYQVSVHLVKCFQRRRFLEIGQSETRIACGGHVCLWIGNKMCNLYKGLFIDASYQVSVHLAKRFQRRKLKCEKLTDYGRQTIDDGWRAPSDGLLYHFFIAERVIVIPTWTHISE